VLLRNEYTDFTFRNDIGPCPLLSQVFRMDCMTLDINITAGFWLALAAVVLALTVGYEGTPTSKMLHRKIDPSDPDPPPSCRWRGRCPGAKAHPKRAAPLVASLLLPPESGEGGEGAVT